MPPKTGAALPVSAHGDGRDRHGERLFVDRRDDDRLDTLRREGVEQLDLDRHVGLLHGRLRDHLEAEFLPGGDGAFFNNAPKWRVRLEEDADFRRAR